MGQENALKRRKGHLFAIEASILDLVSSEEGTLSLFRALRATLSGLEPEEKAGSLGNSELAGNTANCLHAAS